MNSELRIEILKEHVKKVVFVIALFLCLVIFGFLSLPSTDKPVSVFGTVSSLRGSEGDGVRLYLDIKLDNGKKVLVPIPARTGYYRQGERVRLDRRASNFLGGSEYTFGQYVSKSKI